MVTYQSGIGRLDKIIGKERSAMDIILAIGHYLSIQFGSDPDYLNDYLSHMPASTADLMLVVGYLIEMIRGI